jgi:HAD superfamily hydrolase (TIGR01459 family)
MTRIITTAGPLLTEYDVLISDVWGVVHDGARAYEGAGDAFARFRARGGTVLLLSNAPMPSSWVAGVLDEKGVRRDSWDAIVSSGDITLAHVGEMSYRRILHIGTERDLPLIEAMTAASGPFEDAQAIVCTGLEDDRNETAHTYRPLLERALARRLPFVCANPDLVVDVGGELLPCAGVVAELYESMGGAVYWAGKPHAPAYELAMRTIRRIRGPNIDPRRILAIGDAVRTDLAGASQAGLASMFIAQGIHRDEILRHGRIDEHALKQLLSAWNVEPVAAMIGVEW